MDCSGSVTDSLLGRIGKLSKGLAETLWHKDRVISKATGSPLFMGDPTPNPARSTAQNSPVLGDHKTGLKVGPARKTKLALEEP